MLSLIKLRILLEQICPLTSVLLSKYLMRTEQPTKCSSETEGEVARVKLV